MTTATKQAEAIIKERRRAEHQRAVAEEAARIEAEARREAARNVLADRTAAMREAEGRLRALEGATRVELSFFGTRVIAWPERSSDPLVRQTTAHALAESLAVYEQAFDERVGQVRAEAVGRPPAEPRFTKAHVLLRLRDVCRRAVQMGSLTVEEV